MGGDASGADSAAVAADLPTSTALDALYDHILTGLESAQIEPDLRAALGRLSCAARSRDDALPVGLLPVWSYLAAGGCVWTRAVGVAAAWRCLHLAGTLLNSAATSRPSALLPDEPLARIQNAGVGLIFLSQALLAELVSNGVAPRVAVAMQGEFARTGLQAAAGQHVRLQRRTEESWADYQAMVSARSGGTFGLAARAGALVRWSECAGPGEVAGAAPGYIEALSEFGYRMGLMLQLADDFNGVWRSDGRSDLAAGKRSWPLVYAELMADAERLSQLRALVKCAGDDPAAEEKARTLLAQIDVPLAMVLAAEEHRRRAEAALGRLEDSPARRALVALVRRVSLAPREEAPCS